MGKNSYRKMEGTRINNVVIIGSGNVAHHLAMALSKVVKIKQIFSQNKQNAAILADKIGETCVPIDNVNELQNADAYIISIKDDAIAPFLQSVPQNCRNAIWLHTSGSIGRDVFDGFNSRNGVFYPLQTFSKAVALNIREVPFFIEGSNTETEEMAMELAKRISDNVHHADSELRGKLHVAAVFACNFANHMYTLADDLLKENGLPFSVLAPLIKETARKISTTTPNKAQTGPAVRGDMGIIEKHLSMIHDKFKKELYKTISMDILKRYNN